jgi:6-methylsalicylate decarboxylase
MRLPQRLSRATSFCACTSSRRGFLSGLTALGAASTLLPGCATPSSGDNYAATRNRIDTHHHGFSPEYVAELNKAGILAPIVRNWSIAKTLDDMDKAGIATSIMSVTTPQVGFLDGPNAQKIARQSNEWMAKLNSDHPGRFGSFAMLPLHNTDAAVNELAYAMDVLKADGIGLLTSYGDKWLGHPSFAPVMDELNRRKAILYTHPTLASCCDPKLPDTPPTVIEYGTDTARTITDIVFSGTAARCPDVSFIFSHAGGTIPFLVERLIKMPVQDPKLAARVPRGVLTELKRFYYDTAWAAHPGALASLTKLVDTNQILLGSDYPYRTGFDNVKGINEYGFSASELNAIQRGNAMRLIPRLAK